ncbi:MAG: citrate synthase [Proteobacteria bacterium]|nr:citrate synthase [Pseudomonadota bacterium]MBU1688025.1 citrate synthase [Pseudomonadota bacterium]
MGHDFYTGESAELRIGDKIFNLPIVEGTEGERALDISRLRSETGYITLDNGYGNTGACSSNITFLDGEKSVLHYRGYQIEDLAENCSFVEVAYLLIHGELPNKARYERFRRQLNKHSMIHEDMVHFFDRFPSGASPMSILSSMVNGLCNFYPDMTDTNQDEEIYDDPRESFEITAARLLSKVRTIAAFSYKKTMGLPLVYPRYNLSYCANFLNMMFDSPVTPYLVEDTVVDALNKLLILHGDHEQNCSTTTVRLVGSARVNIYASISAGISALWGPLHGGANQAVIEMLEDIHRQGGNYRKFIERAKDPNDSFRLVGFGHRVYKNHDPRSRIIKKACDSVLESLNMLDDPLLALAKELEEVALNDEYFVERRLYPNVDFYSGIIYRAMGIPSDMFTVMFALGRLPGWIAHWREMWDDPQTRIGRPRQVYTGPLGRTFVPMAERE